MIGTKIKRRSVLAKSDAVFDKEIKEIIGARIASGLDRRQPGKPFGRPLIERKIVRHPNWMKIKSDLKIAKFLPEEDAQFASFNWFKVMVVAFLAIMLFAGLIYSMGLITNVMHEAGLSNEVNAGQPGYANLTLAADNTFGKVNESVQSLRLVALTLIMALIIGGIFTNSLVKMHPAYFFIYVLIVVFEVIFAVPVSNAYQDLLVSGVFGGILPSFTGANWVMINLPLVIAYAGILGGILLFINIIRDPNPMELR